MLRGRGVPFAALAPGRRLRQSAQEAVPGFRRHYSRPRYCQISSAFHFLAPDSRFASSPSSGRLHSGTKLASVSCTIRMPSLGALSTKRFGGLRASRRRLPASLRPQVPDASTRGRNSLACRVRSGNPSRQRAKEFGRRAARTSSPKLRASGWRLPQLGALICAGPRRPHGVISRPHENEELKKKESSASGLPPPEPPPKKSPFHAFAICQTQSHPPAARVHDTPLSPRHRCGEPGRLTCRQRRRGVAPGVYCRSVNSRRRSAEASQLERRAGASQLTPWSRRVSLGTGRPRVAPSGPFQPSRPVTSGQGGGPKLGQPPPGSARIKNRTAETGNPC